jgi:hypothetical protein
VPRCTHIAAPKRFLFLLYWRPVVLVDYYENPHTQLHYGSGQTTTPSIESVFCSFNVIGIQTSGISQLPSYSGLASGSYALVGRRH